MSEIETEFSLPKKKKKSTTTTSSSATSKTSSKTKTTKTSTKQKEQDTTTTTTTQEIEGSEITNSTTTSGDSKLLKQISKQASQLFKLKDKKNKKKKPPSKIKGKKIALKLDPDDDTEKVLDELKELLRKQIKEDQNKKQVSTTTTGTGSTSGNIKKTPTSTPPTTTSNSAEKGSYWVDNSTTGTDETSNNNNTTTTTSTTNDELLDTLTITEQQQQQQPQEGGDNNDNESGQLSISTEDPYYLNVTGGLSEKERGPENWNKSDRDYVYKELLERVFGLLQKKNPQLSSGGRAKRIVMKPPQVTKDGAKKTNFANFTEICQSMNRSLDHVSAFLFSELGTNGSVDANGCLIIKGRFLGKQIESLLRKYMAEYVVCHMCNSLETTLNRNPTTRLYSLHCSNCGATRTVAATRRGFVQSFRGKR